MGVFKVVRESLTERLPDVEAIDIDEAAMKVHQRGETTQDMDFSGTIVIVADRPNSACIGSDEIAVEPFHSSTGETWHEHKFACGCAFIDETGAWTK